jgi:hypothetical protein
LIAPQLAQKAPGIHRGLQMGLTVVLSVSNCAILKLLQGTAVPEPQIVHPAVRTFMTPRGFGGWDIQCLPSETNGRDGGTGRRSGLKIVQDSVLGLLKSFKISILL